MSAKYLVAAMLAVALAAPLPAQSVKAGIDAWQKADYSSAIAIWRPLAQAGDADAQFNLGQAYRLGRGVPLDLSVAKIWFERAARSGQVKASPPPLAATVASGGWRIQLGAFSQRASAEALYQRVAGKPAVAGRAPYYVVSGAVTRLQVGPFASKAAATAACGTIGVPCFAVPAR